jgi:hypothetical protein
MQRLLVVLLLLTSACGSETKPHDPDRRLTHDECGRNVDHAIALFGADPGIGSAAASMREGRDELVRTCEATATVSDQDCVMKSKTAYDLSLCPMPGGKP